MFKRLLTIYLPAVIITTTVVVAGMMLYQTNDPELNQVAFKTDKPASIGSPGALNIIENAEEEAEAKLITETEEITTVESVTTEPMQETIKFIEVDDPEIITVVISGPGVSKRCELDIATARTAHQVMKQAADQCGFSYDWKNYPSLGVFVTEMAGVSSNKTTGKYWIYYVNGVKANVGVSSYLLQPGDTLIWQFEQDY